MTRTHRLMLLAILAITMLWSVGWGRNSGHLFGDPLLAREMFAAGDRFASDPLATAGLPVYSPGAAPYTHLTPGPEWIQAGIALLRPPFVPSFRWHSVVTAAVSVLVLVWIARMTRDLLGTLAVRNGESAAWAATLLVGSTPAFIIYAPHPYCLSTLLANAIALAFVRSWSIDPRNVRLRGVLALAGLTFAALFWLGAAPAVSGVIWMSAGLVLFGERASRRRRLAMFVVTIAVTAALCVTLKLLQSVAVLGSWDAAIADAWMIFTRRAIPRQKADLIQDSILFRVVFLFGLALVPLAVLASRSRRAPKRCWQLPAALLVGGFAWQIVMRGHAVYHVYMLRDLTIPIVLTIAWFSVQQDEESHVRWIDLSAFAEWILVLGVLVIPLILTGEPLWRLLRRT